MEGIRTPQPIVEASVQRGSCGESGGKVLPEEATVCSSKDEDSLSVQHIPSRSLLIPQLIEGPHWATEEM